MSTPVSPVSGVGRGVGPPERPPSKFSRFLDAVFELAGEIVFRLFIGAIYVILTVGFAGIAIYALVSGVATVWGYIGPAFSTFLVAATPTGPDLIRSTAAGGLTALGVGVLRVRSARRRARIEQIVETLGTPELLHWRFRMAPVVLDIVAGAAAGATLAWFAVASPQAAPVTHWIGIVAAGGFGGGSGVGGGPAGVMDLLLVLLMVFVLALMIASGTVAITAVVASAVSGMAGAVGGHLGTALALHLAQLRWKGPWPALPGAPITQVVIDEFCRTCTNPYDTREVDDGVSAYRQWLTNHGLSDRWPDFAGSISTFEKSVWRRRGDIPRGFKRFIDTVMTKDADWQRLVKETLFGDSRLSDAFVRALGRGAYVAAVTAVLTSAWMAAVDFLGQVRR